ncbi:hypothetical protein [Verticiella sediminum]|nr:hypothetical protein [Verticiella sediminum]
MPCLDMPALLGYYCVASFTRNTFELGGPAGTAPELEGPKLPG